jgi:hypothetical protein
MPVDLGAAAAGGYVAIIRRDYPQLAVFLDDPEIGPLLLKLAAQRITPSLFQIRLRQTRFWRTHSDTTRQWIMTSALDPASARQQVNQRMLRVQQLAGQLGVHFRTGQNTARQIADWSLRGDWNEDQMLNWILRFATYRDEGRDQSAGLGAQMNTLRTVANQFMINVGDRQLFRDARRVAGGQATDDSIAQRYRQLALDRWAGNDVLQNLIKQGGNPADFFDPYKQMIAEELETSPEGIDFMRDNRFTPITSNVRPDGTVGPMSITEATKHIRSMNEWGNTHRGKSEGATLVNTLSKIFGARR